MINKKKIKMLKQILFFVFLLKYSLVCMEICHIYRNECHDTNYHKTKCLNVKCQGLTRYIVVLYINNLKSIIIIKIIKSLMKKDLLAETRIVLRIIKQIILYNNTTKIILYYRAYLY
jgi:hypothetical protein